MTVKALQLMRKSFFFMEFKSFFLGAGVGIFIGLGEMLLDDGSPIAVLDYFVYFLLFLTQISLLSFKSFISGANLNGQIFSECMEGYWFWWLF